MYYESDKLLYSYVEKWKFFSELVLVLLSRRFEITDATDIALVKTSISEGIGVGVKFDKIYSEDVLGIDTLKKSLSRIGLTLEYDWGNLCDDDYVDTSYDISNEEEVVLVLCVCGDLLVDKVPSLSPKKITSFGDVYRTCFDNLCESIDEVYDGDEYDYSNMNDFSLY